VAGKHRTPADIAYVEMGATAGPEAALPAALLRSRRIRISGSGAGSFSLANLAAQIPGYLQRAFRGRRRLSGAEGEVPLPPLKERTPGRGGTRQGTLRQLVNGRAVRPPTAA
jgi:hypothetical protein